MIFRRKDFFTINYYKAQPYTAGSNGTRIRLTLEDREEDPHLQLALWPEPFSYDKTPDDQKTYHRFDYSEEGIQAVIAWLNENLTTASEKAQLEREKVEEKEGEGEVEEEEEAGKEGAENQENL